MVSLPDGLQNILFCEYRKVNSYTASKACNMSIDRYRILRKILFKHLQAYKLYIDNKKKIDKILRHVFTTYQFLVFKSLMENPFKSSTEIALDYNITPGAVRNLIYNMRKKINKEKEILQFAKVFQTTLFGRSHIWRESNK